MRTTCFSSSGGGSANPPPPTLNADPPRQTPWMQTPLVAEPSPRRQTPPPRCWSCDLCACWEASPPPPPSPVNRMTHYLAGGNNPQKVSPKDIRRYLMFIIITRGMNQRMCSKCLFIMNNFMAFYVFCVFFNRCFYKLDVIGNIGFGGMAEVPSSILIGGNILLLFFVFM